MTRYISLVLITLCLGLAACEQGPFEDPNLDFSNEFPAFVRFQDEDALTATITETEGTTLTIPIEIPSVVYPDTEVSWEVSGDFTANGTGSVPAGLVEGEITVQVPASALAAGDSSGVAVVTLVSATNEVVIGRGENALGDEIDPVSLDINIVK